MFPPSQHKSMRENWRYSNHVLSSSSDCSNFLLCREDVVDFNSDDHEYTPDLDFPVYDEESIAGFIDMEGVFMPGVDYPARFRCRSLDASAREDAISWILKVHAYYGFQPLTAYLSVNYMDRFLSSHRLPQAKGWPLQLLSVACLSLATKMEETLVPSLLDLQVGGARFVFEARTIRRMELLVLTILKWRMRSITPFTFIDFFAYKLDPSGTISKFLILQATQIILATIHVIDFLDYWPSSVAAAATLCAAEGVPNLSVINPGNVVSWCSGLSKERIMSCYRLMQETVVDNSWRKLPKIVPQFRVTTRPVLSSSFSSSSSNKRRKLNNCFWVEGDQER